VALTVCQRLTEAAVAREKVPKKENKEPEGTPEVTAEGTPEVTAALLFSSTAVLLSLLSAVLLFTSRLASRWRDS